jgi:hypothetical protein
MGMDEDQRFQLTNWRVVLKAGSFFPAIDGVIYKKKVFQNKITLDAEDQAAEGLRCGGVCGAKAFCCSARL